MNKVLDAKTKHLNIDILDYNHKNIKEHNEYHSLTHTL